jgi:hypothetical protein
MILSIAISQIADPTMQLSARSALASVGLQLAVSETINLLEKQFISIDSAITDAEIAVKYRSIRAQIVVYQELGQLISQLISETAKRT